MGRSGDSWQDRSRSFDAVSADYADGRPGYPVDVFLLLQERCGLGRGTRVLEIGPGPGQATVPMLEAGAIITAVEPGEALAARLRERTGGKVDVIVSTFETVELPAASFDMVASATAFHWVDMQVGLVRAADVLRDGGWLALWWAIFGDPSRPDPFHDALQPVLAAKAPHLLDDDPTTITLLLDATVRARQIAGIERFGPVEQHVVRWTGRHTPAELRRLFGTFSAWLLLEPTLREELLDHVEALARDRFGGVVERPYQTLMYLAQKTG